MASLQTSDLGPDLSRAVATALLIHRANALQVAWHSPVCPARGGQAQRVEREEATALGLLGCVSSLCQAGRGAFYLGRLRAERPCSAPDARQFVRAVAMACEAQRGHAHAHRWSAGCDRHHAEQGGRCWCPFVSFVQDAYAVSYENGEQR